VETPKARIGIILPVSRSGYALFLKKEK